MNILFITHHKWPHVGGVERHIKFVITNFKFLNKKIKVKIISGEDIKYPDVKIFGLLYIWYWFFKNREAIKNADIIHIHDVFIWYLPFRFLYPTKKVFITFHGWEGKYPIPVWNIWNKKIANYLSYGSIAVGRYIEKYYGIKTNKIIYGGMNIKSKYHKTKNTIVFLGRKDKDTGYFEFLKWLKNHKQYKVKFITGISHPEKYIKTAEYCVPAGYLGYIEAKSYGCKILTFANNSLKKDYWDEIKKIKSFPTWKKIANEYINLYNNI